jgi:hypothetical protein
MYHAIGGIVVAASGTERRGSASRLQVGCLLVASLVRVVHEVAGVSIAGVRLLCAPQLLLAVGVGEGLRKGGRGGRVGLLAIVRKAKVELQSIWLRTHFDRCKRQLPEVMRGREVCEGEGQTGQAGETLAVAATPQATIERVNCPGLEEEGLKKRKITSGTACRAV